ncbi:MAG: phage tail protein [Clostridium sp.]|uniref:phage distal tail protein n=1 Tax=Clostridium sp. TaxID=1506 RepID=UPI001EBB7FD8|nr:phage tail protein [Clostridium sp.]MBS5886302.1 phage tail protein [Clostridium sp.]MDU7148333.1 phage tail protein [Clostridium sp.]
MLINNVDISAFNAKLLKVDIQNSSYSNNSNWSLKNINPVFIENYYTFKKIRIELLFNDENRERNLLNISNLMSLLKREVILKIDGYKNYYKCILSEDETIKTPSLYVYKKDLIFLGYEYGKDITELMNRIANKTINISGNLETPAILEVIPSIDLIDLIINGLDEEPIILKNLKANKKIIVNGEDGTVTVDGVNKYSDTDMWGFPRLKPGANTITVSKNNVDITIKYKPRYI